MSLRTRLASLIAFAIVAAVVAQSVLGFLEFQRVVYSDLDGDLNQFLGLIAGRIESFDDLERLDSTFENYVTRARILDGARVVTTFGHSFPEANGSIGPSPVSNQGWRFAGLALPGLGASVRLEGAINAKKYEQSLERYRRTAVLTGLVFSALGVLLALFLSARALLPLDVLLGTISQVADSGDLTLRVPAEGHRELARLSAGFNRMLERLQAYRQRETEFTRHASHELRTPLTAIGLEISSYHEGVIGAEEALLAIEREAGRMRRLSEALLILAREGTPELCRLDLSQLAQTCATRFGAQFLGPSHLEILGNAALIERALENLLENASKYAPDSSVEIRLERRDGFAEPSVIEPSVTELSVTDHGPGMNRQALERATDIFFRAPGTTGNGSGVGLSVVKRIMEAHGGRVLLEGLKPSGLKVKLAFVPEAGPSEIAKTSAHKKT
jgi:signal transduction histidine kinase